VVDISRSARVSLTSSSNRASTSSFSWRSVDAILLATVVALSGFGLLMISSATKKGLLDAGLDPNKYLKKQIMFMVLGLGVMIAVAASDLRSLLDYSPIFYGVSIISLAGLYFVAAKRGAQGWYDIGVFQLQPAEFSKIVVMLVLANYVSEQQGLVDLRRLFAVLAITGLPAGMIFLQPDLGSALVYFCVMLAILWVGGARGFHVAAVVGTGTAAVLIGRRFGFVRDYQWRRLTSFLDGSANTRDDGYNVLQSKIAVGSGGLQGQGLYQGTQTSYGFIPERQTDFIFSVIGEQLGLVGGCVVLVLLMVLCLRIWRIAVTARDTAGTLVCIGVLAMFVFQTFQNIGMTIGIMPVTGIPLPFVSYGGSSTITAFAGIGLVLNVARQR
jgi:rod shape determining protein RodA